MNSRVNDQGQPAAAMASGVLGILALLSGAGLVGGGFSSQAMAIARMAFYGTLSAGIHKQCRLSREDYLEGGDLALRCFGVGAEMTGVQQLIAPAVTELKRLPGIENHTSKQTFNLSDMLERSAVVVGPTGTGKSWFSALAYCELEAAFPSASWTICSVNNWGGQSWMGLKDCPEWLQRHHLRFGWAYKDESEIETATHRETDDAVDALFAEMQRRAKAEIDGEESTDDWGLVNLGIDEWPSYFSWLEQDKKKERLTKIQKILCQGRKYRVTLWIVSQSDAVNMLGLNESHKENLLIVRLFKPGPFSPIKAPSIPQQAIEMVNAYECRRLLMLFNGMAKVMPIPEMDQEPVMDWTAAIEQGEAYSWLDRVKKTIQAAKSSRVSMTALWAELTKHHSFPATGNKRQRADNPHYAYFRELYEGA